MRRVSALVAAGAVAVGLAACEAATAPDQRDADVAFDHIGGAPIGEGHLTVCKNGTDADFMVEVVGGSTTALFVAAGTCEEANQVVGSQTVVVTEVASSDYVLVSVSRQVIRRLANGTIVSNVTDSPAPPVSTTYDEDEEVILTFLNSPVRGGGEGCTPGYWKNHTSIKNNDAWVGTGLVIGDSYDTEFGVTSTFGATFTLLEALQQGGGGEKALGRHATAALLNSLNGGVSFAFTSADVIAIVVGAYAGGTFSDFTDAKNLLVAENEMGCPL